MNSLKKLIQQPTLMKNVKASFVSNNRCFHSMKPVLKQTSNATQTEKENEQPNIEIQHTDTKQDQQNDPSTQIQTNNSQQDIQRRDRNVRSDVGLIDPIQWMDRMTRNMLTPLTTLDPFGLVDRLRGMNSLLPAVEMFPERALLDFDVIK
jgi:hypothetical protein